MPTTTTALFDPVLRGSNLSAPLEKYLFTLQNRLLLKLVDTGPGGYVEALPPAGLNSTTGQSNQNQEIVYKKSSPDGNTFQITGGAEGTQSITTQFSSIRFKSDGTDWWVVG